MGGASPESPLELPGGLGRQEWVPTFPMTSMDPASGLEVNPAPDPPLSLHQDEADRAPASGGTPGPGCSSFTSLRSYSLSGHEVDAGSILHIGPLTRPLPSVCRARDWWWVPVVAPPLGAYLGGIIYLVFIGCAIPREPQISESRTGSEDHRVPVLPKAVPPQTEISSLNSVSVSPLTSVSVSSPGRPSVRSIPPLSDSIRIQQF